MIKIFELLNKYHNLNLIICGKGNLAHKIKEICLNKNNIYYLGYVSDIDMNHFLNVVDYFISFSCYEGLPMTTLESINYGVQYILSDIPAHRYFINNNLGNGIIIDLNNIDISKTLGYINTKHSKNKNNDFSNFHWDMIIKTYIKLF